MGDPTVGWRVRVPATSANLGPAFDSAGLALARHDVLDVSVTDGLEVEVAGVGAADLPREPPPDRSRPQGMYL